MELSTRAADDEAAIRIWRGGEEGMEARGLGDVHFALVPWAILHCGKTFFALPLVCCIYYGDSAGLPFVWVGLNLSNTP